ncbi:MAG TPA: sigma 54-interacting transcriptional regulator [Kofleriaceae bacterium]|nr:sigma 54-interacting transcriptional regulator [Kofleriaceae bacterium]
MTSRRARSTRSARPAPPGRVLAAALEDLAGAVIVLDARLGVVHATAEAEHMIGAPVRPGISIVKILCGDTPERPIAESLAAGRETTGSIVRDATDGTIQTLHVRATPIQRDGERIGWTVTLDEAERRPAASEGPPVLFHGMWTCDPGMKRVFHIIERAAAREVGVLVRGPTGSGKELVAHAIHALSARAQGPFRAINCAALPPALLESELFGHVKGAFTGAVRDHQGIFRAAHRGTLFLDEVAELPLELQAKLLRVLETRTVIPVGSTEPLAVDARIIAATHQPLRTAVEQGRFRADLMYRLRIVPVFLPPLAARRGDVALLTHKLIEQLNDQGKDQGGRQIARVSPGALEALADYPWPGNVRELRSALEYAYVIGDGSQLVEPDLPPEITGTLPVDVRTAAAPTAGGETQEARRIRVALERASGSRERAAQILGMSRVTLWRRMRAYGLLDPEEVTSTLE